MELEGGDGVHHGIESFFQAFCEWCDNAAKLLDALGTDEHANCLEVCVRQRLQADANVFRQGARRYAEAALDATRILAGDDHPATKLWSSALERGCWLPTTAATKPGDGAGVAAPPDFEAAWRAGCCARPLSLPMDSRSGVEV